jgi:hypothetical protein
VVATDNSLECHNTIDEPTNQGANNMGYSTALDLATSGIDLKRAVSIHFSSNCYPPVPQLWVDQAVVAIYDVASDDGDNLVDLPDGVTKPDGSTKATAYQIVDSLRLNAFVSAVLAEQDEE